MKNELLVKMGAVISKKSGKAGLILKKKSPEILMAAGLVGFVGTVVLACRSTLKADEVLEVHRLKMKDIHDAKKIAEENKDEYEYDESMYRRDVGVRYVKTVVSMARLYAAPIALGSISVACILTSNRIIRSRYLGAVAAYNGLHSVFEKYRDRVKEEYGEQLDRHFRYGTTYDTIIEKTKDEDGKTVKNKIDTENTPYEVAAPKDETSRFFDSSNPNWDRNPEFNLMFLNGQLMRLNDLLHTRGHVFLNEVYEAFGFEHTTQGAVLGWLDGEGCDRIRIGLEKGHDDAKIRRFVNGDINTILLDFNVQGTIYDKI